MPILFLTTRSMITPTLLEFIARENAILLEKHFNNDKQLSIHVGAIKMAEELGELCAEVLATSKLQRAEKLDAHSHESLDEEFADVIITTLLLADSLNVEVNQALEKKMQKIVARREKAAA